MTSKIAVRLAGIAVGVATAAALTACGTGSDDPEKLTIVASTNVWGDIAEQVAGPDVEVESLISDPSADPHSYEVTAVEAAKISDADLIVYNGGGYDEFIDKAIAGKDKRTVNAVEVAGEDPHAHDAPAATEAKPDEHADEHRDEHADEHGHDHGDGNEHVWYDVHVAGEVANHIAEVLGELDPGNKQSYADRAVAFNDKLTAIETTIERIAAEHPNTPVVQTEPLAYYLLLDAKADDRTPPEFQEAIEQGTDPSPASVAAVRDLLTGKQVRALVYNIQTEDKTTKELKAMAEAAGIPVVEVTETLPEGLDYIQWQTRNAEALAKALS
ncbi:zinc ABC transporter substrate-binding protein [Nocardia otitidiscaviarum]|uniref:metal ABC transporter solute-binding protein, Zn/Mn family n=1 Tax=Nocardia otitidiscaviarum TaxID=1823 RepID=UPI0018935065|nr:zinc ABC transporter substrate-binding protein [Nocardia otitidiscaviarum]MBF6236206.1 zinc ABC transporter substrate-binding protein [Nocardia otitidiscaviarum]